MSWFSKENWGTENPEGVRLRPGVARRDARKRKAVAGVWLRTPARGFSDKVAFWWYRPNWRGMDRV
jgi:hypothetical protein